MREQWQAAYKYNFCNTHQQIPSAITVWLIAHKIISVHSLRQTELGP